MTVQTKRRIATISEIVDNDGRVLAKGQTVLSPEDTDVPRIGEDISLGRAFRQLLDNQRLEGLLEKLEGLTTATKRVSVREVVRGFPEMFDGTSGDKEYDYLVDFDGTEYPFSAGV